MIANGYTMEAIRGLETAGFDSADVDDWEPGEDADTDALIKVVLFEVLHNYRHREQFDEQIRTGQHPGAIEPHDKYTLINQEN